MAHREGDRCRNAAFPKFMLVWHLWLEICEPSTINPDKGWLSCAPRWWGEQGEARREQVRQLVKAGRLDFVNGGVVQHDEAGAHYVAMIDQTTRGHRWVVAEGLGGMMTKGCVWWACG